MPTNLEHVERMREVMFGSTGAREAGASGEALAEALDGIASADLRVLMAGGALTNEYVGIDGLQAGWTDFLSAFDGLTIEFEESVAGGDWVVDLVRLVGAPKGTAAKLEQPGAAAFRFSDGLITRVEFHVDRAAALRSAGLGA